MASSREFVEYVCDQLSGTGDVRSRKMFGEYMIYVNDKPLVLVCDDTAYVRMHGCLEGVMDRTSTGIPYQGAKPHYILDVDDGDRCAEIIALLEPVVPVPKKRAAPKKEGERA